MTKATKKRHITQAVCCAVAVAAADRELAVRLLVAQERKAKAMLAVTPWHGAARPTVSVQVAAARAAREPMLPQQRLTA